MTRITLDRLSAYHDRELAPGEAAPLREALAGDPEARRLLEDFERIDEAARAGLATDADAPVPLSLARTVRKGFAARRRRAAARTFLRWAGPVAASVAVVLFGQHMAERQAAQALKAREARIAALTDRAVQDALETALSGSKVAMSDPAVDSSVAVTPIRTYRSTSDRWCREFVEDLAVDGRQVKRTGVACRQTDGGWARVETRQEGALPPPVGATL